MSTTEEKEAQEKEAELVELIYKLNKAKYKRVFTRYSNQLKDLLREDDIAKIELRLSLEKVEGAMDRAVETIHSLLGFMRYNGKTQEMLQLTEELSIIDKQYEQLSIDYRQLDRHSALNTTSNHQEIDNNTKQLGQDMWRQMKKVSIPIFNGEKKGYQSWKAAFLSCVDQAPATAE